MEYKHHYAENAADVNDLARKIVGFYGGRGDRNANCSTWVCNADHRRQ